MVGSLTETVDDVLSRVRNALTGEKLRQLDDIASRIVKAEEEFRGFLRAIRKRPTATFYVNISKLNRLDRGATLSVRVSGVECGEVHLSKRRSERTFTPKHTEDHFAGCWTARTRRLPWRDAFVRRYLEAAAKQVLSGDLMHRECGVEAALIRELREGRLRYNKPVLFPSKSGVPYQFPVPITARDEIRPAMGKHAGHVDVLARHGRGRTSRLRIFEVKRPDAGDAPGALDQAVAYAVALDCLLRRGHAYRKLLGYPKYLGRLEATAVVADSNAARSEMSRAKARLGRSANSLDVTLSMLFYRWEEQEGERRLALSDDGEIR